MTAPEPLSPQQLAGGAGPDLVTAAEQMLRGGDGFAIALTSGSPPLDGAYAVTTVMGRLRVRWDPAGDLRAVATTPRAGLATRFRGRLGVEATGPVLRGTARNRTPWLWLAIFAPAAVVFAALTVGTAVDGSWGPFAFSVVVLALCVLGWHQLGRRTSSIELQGSHLADLARTLWDREGVALFELDVPGPAGEAPRGRPVTPAERELLDEVVLALREGDPVVCRQALEEYEPMTPTELAELFATFSTEELVPEEIVEAAADVCRRLGR